MRSVSAGGGCAVRGGGESAAACGTGACRSSLASQEASAGPGGPGAALPGTGWVVGVRWRQWVVVRVGLGPGAPLGVDVMAGGIWWLVRGWPLVVGGVFGWSARSLPCHTLVLFVLWGLWPVEVGWWAVVVVGVVSVVVVVGPLVVVALVVVGLVWRVWP